MATLTITFTTVFPAPSNGYNIRYRTPNGTNQVLFNRTGSPVIISGLPAGVAYEGDVQSSCGTSLSSWVPFIAAVPGVPGTVSCPVPVNASSVYNPTSNTLEITLPVQSNPQPTAGWNVVYQNYKYLLQGSTLYPPYSLNTLSNTFTLSTGIVAGDEFAVRITADCGTTNTSGQLTFYAEAASNCNAPANIVAAVSRSFANPAALGQLIISGTAPLNRPRQATYVVKYRAVGSSGQYASESFTSLPHTVTAGIDPTLSYEGTVHTQCVNMPESTGTAFISRSPNKPSGTYYRFVVSSAPDLTQYVSCGSEQLPEAYTRVVFSLVNELGNPVNAASMLHLTYTVLNDTSGLVYDNVTATIAQGSQNGTTVFLSTYHEPGIRLAPCSTKINIFGTVTSVDNVAITYFGS